MRQKQQGISLLGFLFWLILIGLAAFIGMKLFPMYSEYYGVKKILKSMANEPGLGTQGAAKIKESLSRRMDVGYIDSVDLQKNVKLTPSGSGTRIDIKYEVRKPLVGNLSLVGDFEASEQLGAGGGSEY